MLVAATQGGNGQPTDPAARHTSNGGAGTRSARSANFVTYRAVQQ
jgi:hypothetical protein